MFFVGRGEMVSPLVQRTCGDCPVHGECYDYALRYEQHGYWAGTSERERHKTRVQLGITVIVPQSGFVGDNGRWMA